MPAFQDFSLTPNGRANITQMPRVTIACRVEEVNEQGQWVTVADFTGANAIDFPAELKNRTDAEVAYIIEQVAYIVVLMKAGLWTQG
jgi:hypothetical protein